MIDISENEYNMLKKLHYNISYTQSEAEFLLEMTKRFVDEHARVCTSCNSSVSKIKQKIYGWFNSNVDAIEKQLFPKEDESSLDKAKKEVN